MRLSEKGERDRWRWGQVGIPGQVEVTGQIALSGLVGLLGYLRAPKEVGYLDR